MLAQFAMSPMSSLPPELLLKVFAFAQSNDPYAVRRTQNRARLVAMA